jgi:rfaE bifunctional protein nucleotidyltransferase chain/domain
MKKSEIAEHKLYQLKALMQQIAVWRFQNRKIVFTNGCFDILHKGHAHVINACADLSYNVAVVVGLNTDASVKRLKGASRPVNNENDRALMLANLHSVDAVILFDDDTPLELIKSISPDYLVKGGDYNADTIVGADIVKNNGGSVVIVPFLDNYSTTSILERK